MKAIVLAAGRGERMRPLTDTTPKILLPVAGKPLAGHHLEALARAGIRDVVMNLSWLGGCIRAALGDGHAFGVRLTYVDEGPVALETGGGIFNALPALGSAPFLVVNGDVWTDFDLGTLRLEAAAHGRLVLVPNPPHHPRGDFGLEGDRVVARAADRFTYAGIGIFRPELFRGRTAGRYPLLPLLESAIAAGTLRGQVHRGEWFDVGTPERLDALRRRVGRGV